MLASHKPRQDDSVLVDIVVVVGTSTGVYMNNNIGLATRGRPDFCRAAALLLAFYDNIACLHKSFALLSILRA